MRAVGSVIDTILLVLVLLLIARFILDWVQLLARDWRPKGFVLVICEALYSLTDPPLRLVRGVIPPLRLGGAALDLSPMILLIGIYLLRIVNGAIFF